MTRRNCRKKSWCWQSGDRERWMRLLFRQPRRERSRASDAGAQSFSRLLREAGSFHSRQAASRLLAQHSQWLRAFGPRSVRKLPGGKIFDSDLLADIVNDALAFRTALDVIYVLESEAEHFLLIGAVWTPPGTIHLCAFSFQTLSEAVERAYRLAKIKQIVCAPGSDNHDQGDSNPKPARTRPRSRPFFAFFAEFEHAIEFLYHDVQYPRQHVQTLAM